MTSLTASAPRLTGDAMVATIDALIASVTGTPEVITTGDKVRACGYVKEDGNLDYVGFYTALIEAKGILMKDYTPQFEEGSIAETLAETYPAEAIQAFIDYWGVENLNYFEDSYYGEFESGAEFAKDFVEGTYGESNLPSFVEVNWDATWDNLSEDFIDLEGFTFSTRW
jgi:hypothetical protein